MRSEQAKRWVVPEDNRPPEKFWIDFGNFVMMSKQYDNTDHYWKTLIRWADHLMKRYNANTIVCHIVMDYLDGQSKRSLNNKPREIA